MQKINAAITSVGGYVPEYRLTNAELEKMVDTNDEWIRTRTGISERRILKEEGLGSSDMAVPAVIELCKKRGINTEEIDCLICATVTPDMVFPATANIICDKIGAINAFSFDIMAACSGFLYALTTGTAFIEKAGAVSSSINFALVSILSRKSSLIISCAFPGREAINSNHKINKCGIVDLAIRFINNLIF